MKLRVLLFALFLPAAGWAAQAIKDGSFSGNGTLTGNLTVASGGRITIASGGTIVANAGSTVTGFGGGGGGSGDLLSTNNLSDLSNSGTALTNLGGTTAGKAIFTVTNPSAVTWLRLNADNTVTPRTAAQTRTDLSLVPGTDVQAYSSNLATFATIAPTANVQSLLGAADYSAMRTQLSLVPGTNVQAYSSNLATYAGITPSANIQSFLGAADYSAMRTQLGLVIGTNVQAYDADLTTWAGITPGTGVATALGSAVSGSGGLLAQTDPIILRPNAAMSALEIDVTKANNTKTLTGTTATLTFSATPTAGQTFGVTLTGYSSDCVVTIPSSKSLALNGATTTAFTVRANSVVEVSWRYNGSVYILAGEPRTIAELSAGDLAADGSDHLLAATAASGNEFRATVADVAAFAVQDSTYGSGLNGVTTKALSQNALYDYLHLIDTDDDGKVNVLDATAGLIKTDANGVVSNATSGTDYSPAPSDTALAGSWNGVTTTPPTKNAVYDGIVAAVAPTFAIETDGATITWTADPLKAVQNSTVTLGGNRTLAMSGWASGQTGVLIVKQDATGSRTLALPSSSKVINGGSGAITLTTTANGIDILTVVYDGTNYFWTYGKNFN